LPVNAADVDLSIVVGTAPEGGHICHRLFSQTFVAACSPTLLQRIPINAIEDLNRHTLITHEARRDAWQRWAQPLGVELRPKKLVRFDSMHAAAQAAQHGVGVALVSVALGHERFTQGSLVKLFDAELRASTAFTADRARGSCKRARNRASRHTRHHATRDSSRSAKTSAKWERRRGGGRIPPVRDRMPPIAEWLRSKSLAIAFSDPPRRQRSHINALSASVYWILVRCFMCNTLVSTLRV
jgi:DNA-binding transcriptional LysR family regulator